MLKGFSWAVTCVAVVALAPAPASAQSAADAAAACSAGSNLPEAVCACVGERAADQLNDTQRQWYIHAASGDSDAAQALLGSMSPTETIEAATFARTAPVDCVRGG
ncbi:MAG: hypothetical protein H6843_03000 [Rhodospirillaceae bacterium]|nr:hypothetical protein [Rhodospirillaceae bacterium]